MRISDWSSDVCSSDLLNVEGTATLGGTLQLVYGPDTYTTKTYTIVKGSPLTGKFSKITDNKPSDVTQSVTYTPATVDLTITSGVIAPQNGTGRASCRGRGCQHG